MGVVGKRIIFCEGKGTSFDSLLLNRIVEGLSGDRPTIVPIGGKFGASTFAQGYFFPEEVHNQQYIFFRDRDFDEHPTEEVQLLEMVNNRGKILALLTHRTCVENYLLDANLIHEYWIQKYIEKQENPSSRWGHGGSPGANVISDWIESSARALQEYQAVRWALGDLLKTVQERTQLKTTWTVNSGKLPQSLTSDACKAEAKGLVSQFIQATAYITEEKFEERLIEHQQKFSGTEFWSAQSYLIWFHGKDLKKMMNRQQPTYISLDNFFEWAVNTIDINSHPDLVNLRTRIEEL